MKIYAFIPCHNRAAITISTLESIDSQLSAEHQLEIHLLDDGSNDGTSRQALAKIECIKIHRLSGKHFWGGSLNYIIDFCQSVIDHSNPNDVAILIANDDILLKDGEELKNGLQLLCQSNAGIIAPVLEEIGSQKEGLKQINCGIIYNSNCNHFVSLDEPGEVNVALTAATWFSLDAMLKAEKIPKGIPHYCSDFWLTHQLSQSGVIIRTDNRYKVSRYAMTTRQSYGRQSKIKYWRSCCDPKSPDYLPAALMFESRFNRQQQLWRRLLILKIKIFVLKLLFSGPKNTAILE